VEKDDGFALAFFHEGDPDPGGIEITVFGSGFLGGREYRSGGQEGCGGGEDTMIHA